MQASQMVESNSDFTCCFEETALSFVPLCCPMILFSHQKREISLKKVVEVTVLCIDDNNSVMHVLP